MNTAKKVREGNLNFDLSFQVQLPTEWQKLASNNIGVTAGSESTSVHDAWNQACRNVEALIVPSHHSKNSFDKEYHEKINVVSFPTKNITPDFFDIGAETPFNFLTVAQWGPRKNIEQCIASFVEEFKDEEVGLIMKLGLKGGSKIDREFVAGNLARFIQNFPEERKCKLYLLHGNLTESQMCGLYHSDKVHAYINTSHGEGFGLPIFEASQIGLPVVSGLHSGECDFLKEGYITEIKHGYQPVGKGSMGMLPEDSEWASYLNEDIRSAMRSVYSNYNEAKEGALNLSDIIKKEKSEQIINKLYNNIVLSFINNEGEENEVK